MAINQQKHCSYWPIILALLLLTAAASTFVGGITEMISYSRWHKKLNYDAVSLHFFTREYIKNQYQKFTAKSLPVRTSLPSFNLYVDEKDLDALESDLPASAKLQYAQSNLKVDKPPFSSEARFRYRGGLALHWLYKKKSLRIKLPPFTTYRNERQFNLVNPSTLHTITDWVSYDMARSIGLLTPDYFPARVFINNETNGLHFFLSQIDESFLRKNNRMPGSIYSGDTIYMTNPFGSDFGGEIVFDTEEGTSAIWIDERLWDKDASRNSESSENRDDIKKFVSIINEPDPLSFMRLFETYFEKEKFYQFWALDRLVGSYHHDFFHNHKIYFDPYKGKFEPIEWDLRYWSVQVEIPVTPFMKQILLNPVLKYERDLVVFDLWNRFPTNHVIKMIDDANKEVIDELAADPYRQHPAGDIKKFAPDKVTSFTMDEYKNSIEDLKQIYKVRHDLILQSLNLSMASYTIENISKDKLKLDVAIDGYTPVNFDPWSIIPESDRNNVRIYRVFENERQAIPDVGEPDRLYPGIKTEMSDKLSKKNISVNGREKYSSSPLHYSYLITGKKLSDIELSDRLIATNAITSKKVNIENVDILPEVSNTVSLHPWHLLFKNKKIDRDIVLSGEIEVTQDMIFTENQTVRIMPGTIFKMSQGKSIIFYGKVIAKGTDALPIRFERKDAGEAWGSIVIQGKNASGSYLDHIHVSGGSVVKHNLINYPGEINIHDVDDFHLLNCSISNNIIGDDALHVAYSKGRIEYCEFYNTAFDALDMDIVDVSVTDSSFSNIGNDGIDLMNSKVRIRNVVINDTGDKCISVGEASNVTIANSQLEECHLGIAVKDASIVNVENISFLTDQGKAIALYRKNQRYSRGGKIDGNWLYGITENDIDVGEYSVNNIQKDAYQPLSTRDHEHEGNQ